MLIKTRIAICLAVAVCSASAGFAKDHNVERNGARAAAVSSSWHAFGQAHFGRSNPKRQSFTGGFARAPARVPMSGAEWWVSHSNAEEGGFDYR